MANRFYDGSNSFTVLPSAARTTAITAAAADCFQLPVGAMGLTVILNSTAITSSPSITFSINAVDILTGATNTLLTSAAVTTGSTTRQLQIGLGIAVVANLSASVALPGWFNVSVAVTNSNSITYSIGASVT